jgi:hypothetical protein
VPGIPGGMMPIVWYLVAYAWIVGFVLLVLGHYRTAQVIAALAIVPYLVWLLRGEFIGAFQGPSLGPWASGLWSLTLTLLAADAGAYRLFSVTDYLHDPHLINVSRPVAPDSCCVMSACTLAGSRLPSRGGGPRLEICVGRVP